MDERLVAANAALKEGRAGDAIALMLATLETAPAQPAQFWRVLVLQLYRTRRYAEGETWAAKAVEQHPRDVEMWNLRGVILRQLRRYPEALRALNEAARLDPAMESVQVNRGNVMLDMGDAAGGEAVFGKLVRQKPRNAEFQRQLGRAMLRQGKVDAALVRFRQATSIAKDHIEAWLDLIGAVTELDRHEEAERLVDKALAANPDHPRLLEARIIGMRRAGQPRRAEAYMAELLERLPNAAWLHHQLGQAIGDVNRDRASAHFRRAIELDPASVEYRVSLIESLERTRTGDEGANIEEAYQQGKALLAQQRDPFTPGQLKVLHELFVRVVDFDAIERLGDVQSLGRAWSESARHTALLKLMPRVRTMEDRYTLLEQHRVTTSKVEGNAARQPIRRPKPRAPGGKIRLGFVSSDLRRHPVAYFSEPLFRDIDPRFEVFCYSYYQGAQADPMQDWIASQVAGFRWNPDISDRDAAQVIADDSIDYLIELGGSTHMNKLEVMAYRPAALQASWLGYPHSAGLSTIDDLIVDPYLKPEPVDLMLENPLEMPATWIALGHMAFPDVHQIDPIPPFQRQGRITFGTANNPYKYSREMLDAWARVVAAVPGSRFTIVRPEGSSAGFRRNIAAAFAARGVSEDRLEFISVRAVHIPHYNQIDIALDTFPQTGGTTTCEAAWMGVPTVSLVGPAIYERLSYSILNNAGLGDLCVRSVDDYVAKAVALAADTQRLTDLRRGLREQLRASPLGRTRQFAQDFYDLIARRVESGATVARR